MKDSIEKYTEGLKKICEVSKMGCCPGCGITPEALTSLTKEVERKERERIEKDIKQIICGSSPQFFTSKEVTDEEMVEFEDTVYETRVSIEQNIDHYFNPKCPPYNQKALKDNKDE